MFGSGKLTFANTIVSRYMDMGLLGVSFRFSKNIDGRNLRTLLFRNIAYQLAFFNSQFRKHLLLAIDRHEPMGNYPLRDQLEMFIIKPLHEVAFLSPVLVVIDALDECGTEQERNDLLEAIAKDLSSLPNFVKVLVTS
jgi:hypothetical protein